MDRHRLAILATTGLALTGLALPAVAQDIAAPQRLAAARRIAAAAAEDGTTPSLAVAVIDGGELIWAEGFGVVDMETERPATADTIYRLASISKPFTATAVMQLVERGTLELDAPVNRYLDRPFVAMRGVPDQITLRRLLNHTAGLPTHWNFFYRGEAPPPRDVSIDAWGFAANAPGTDYRYSNLAFGALDHVIARVSGTSYRGFVVDELCNPLGMDHTDVGVRPGCEDLVAKPYERTGAGWREVVDYGFDHDGASAVRSSARDLMRFARLQIDAGTIDGRRVLSEALVRAMREPRARDAGSSFGVGWAVGTFRGRQVLSHTGGMPGVSTRLEVFPGDRAAFAVLTNTSAREATRRTSRAIRDALIPGELESDAVEAKPSPPDRPAPALPTPGAYCGVLRHPDGLLPVRLTLDGERQGSLTLGASSPVVLGSVAHTDERLDFRVTPSTPWPIDFGHGVGTPRQWTFELEVEGEGFAGIAYATQERTHRLPLWCELARERDKPTDTLRVISYNVLIGFGDSDPGRFLPGERRRAAIASWLAAQRPDVVALQEMNGFTEDSLRRLAAAWHHPHVALLKEDGYPVALTSSRPIENIGRLREGLHHGMLHGTTHGVEFIVVHFRPQSDLPFKRAECAQALGIYRQALTTGREAIVLGDFNSIHPDDVSRFSAAAHERYDRWRYHEDGGRPAEIVMAPLLDAGARDPFEVVQSLPAELPLPRIDFALASPKLAARAFAAQWLCEGPFLRWSDHPPVAVDFRIP